MRSYAHAVADDRAQGSVVSEPYEIGGSRMGAIALQPHVAEFLDEVLHDEIHDVEIRQLTIGASSPVAGAVLSTVAGAGDAALVVAVRDTDGHCVTNCHRIRCSPPATC
jgi:hypothetical protein